VNRPEADVDAALDQIEYVADELESLSHLIERVPDAILSTPAGEKPSIAVALALRHQRDGRLLEAVRQNHECGMMNDEWSRVMNEGDGGRQRPDAPRSALSPTGDPRDLPEILRASAATRRELAAALRDCIARAGHASEPRRSETAAKLYALIHADTNLFREIAYLLHAGPVTK